MKAVYYAFLQVLRSISKDYMMLACLFAPILIGLALRFGIPALETLLCAELGRAAVLLPYYALFDLFLAVMTPLMLVFSGIMVILEEIDNGTAKYLMVTPLGRRGYLLSRIGVLALLSIGYNALMLALFTLSGMPAWMLLLSTLCAAALGIVIALMVIAFAANKVEGMALVKLGGLMLLGMLAAYFVPGAAKYIGAVLPTFWMAQMVRMDAAWYALAALAVSAVWALCLFRRFKRKLL